MFPGDVKIDHILPRVADRINADIWRRQNIRRRQNSSLCILHEELTSRKLGLLYYCTDIGLEQCEGVKQRKRQHLSYGIAAFFLNYSSCCVCMRVVARFLARDSIYAIARYMPSPVRLSVRHTGGSVKDV